MHGYSYASLPSVILLEFRQVFDNRNCAIDKIAADLLEGLPFLRIIEGPANLRPQQTPVFAELQYEPIYGGLNHLGGGGCFSLNLREEDRDLLGSVVDLTPHNLTDEPLLVSKPEIEGAN